jgi:DNA-binding CsgD family transcriptional regulator
MDQVVSDHSRLDSRLERVTSALGRGLIFVDTSGQIIWIDERTRRRVNGGLQALDLPVRRSDERAVDCFLSAAEVTIEGEKTAVCVIQEVDARPETGFDLAAALEAVMTDTSWFTRTIVEKLRQAKMPVRSSSGLELLSDREREVLGLICEGRSDAEMSTMLDLSHNTVRNHIASLYRKIGVNRRGAAIIWARERGITSLDAFGSAGHRRVQVKRSENTKSY